jgi:hypothetical protein
MAAPAKFKDTFIPNEEKIPDKDTLRKDGWAEVKVRVAPERSPVITYGSEAHRRQYTLRHLVSPLMFTAQ